MLKICDVMTRMYKDVRSKVGVGDNYSAQLGVGVCVRQGSTLCPLL